MDHDMLRETLFAVACQVLEEASFVFVEPAAEPIDGRSWPGPVVRVQLPFNGPVRGRFMLVASSGMGGTLAAGMLGAELGEPEADAKAEDALGEVLNMMAGMALEQALGAGTLWDLGVPEVRRMSPAEYVSGPRPDVRVCLDSEEEEPLEVAIFFEKGEC
jgi:CheY-specific phosphatase CheX